MKVRNLVLVGAMFALTALAADAQGRRGGGNGNGGRGYSSYNSGRNYDSNGYNSRYRGVPVYSSGFNNGFNNGYNNGYNNFNRGSGLNFGIALGTRSPYSYGTPYYGQSYSYGRPYYGQSYMYGTPSYGQTYYYSTPSVVVPETTILPTTYTVPTTVAPSIDTGLRITTLNEGTAKRAGLRAGDIILKVNDRRTQNFETLRDVLATSGKTQVEIEFVDASNNTVQRRNVGVENTKIGVSVEEVAVERK